MTYRLSTSDSLAQIFSQVAETVGSADEEIHILLSDGEHHGLEHERLFYDLPNPLVIESESGESSKCALRSENCEAFHKDTENRAVITFGEKCTSVTLKNFTIENTHVKSCESLVIMYGCAWTKSHRALRSTHSYN